MIPSFTLVEWAIVGGAVFSFATLVFVSLDFYWDHAVTERSEIKLRPSSTRDTNHNSSGHQKARLYSPCTIVNEGQRPGIVRGDGADIEFSPSGKEYSWEKLTDSLKSPSISVRFEENSVPANSTIQGSVRFKTGQTEDEIISLFRNQESVNIDCVIDVEDNEGHYQIEYSDKIDLS